MPWPPSCPRPASAPRFASSGQRGRAAEFRRPRPASSSDMRGPGDHRRVVGAEPQRRRHENDPAGSRPPPPAPRGARHCRPRRRPRRRPVTRSPAPPAHSARAAPFRPCTSRTAAWNPAHRSARSRRRSPPSAATSTSRARSTAVFRPEKDRSQSGRSSSGRGRRSAAGSPFARLGLDRGAAGLGQAQEPRDLVERLAGRIVDGAAQTREIASGPRRSGTGNARRRPAAEGRERPAALHAAASARGPPGGSPPSAAGPARRRWRLATSTPDTSRRSAPAPPSPRRHRSSSSPTPGLVQCLLDRQYPAFRHGRGRQSRAPRRQSAACSAACPSTTEDQDLAGAIDARAPRPRRCRRS